jgi:predicted Fe-Mo cluster-binding NifX family protein
MDDHRVCRIAVTSTKDSIDGEISSIGTSDYFIIFEGGLDKHYAIDNGAKGLGSDAGIRAVEILKEKDVAALITSNIGERSIRAFQKEKITVYAGCSGQVKGAIERCMGGKLLECNGATYAGPMKW